MIIAINAVLKMKILNNKYTLMRMVMMNENIISYDLSLILYNSGFKKETKMGYMFFSKFPFNRDAKILPAPTLEELESSLTEKVLNLTRGTYLGVTELAVSVLTLQKDGMKIWKDEKK